MSSQKKLIEDILSSYNTILEKKLMFEVTDTYSNINFVDNVVGNSTPSKDNISTTLLQDIQTAAESVGLMVDVTTAVSGHKPSKRHDAGQAVDIAQINGKSVSTSNRADADKLVDALVSMGYTKNSEGTNSKAVLTFGFDGHDNHVHVSNTGGSSTQQPTTSGDTTKGNDGARQFAKDLGSKLLNVIGIKESFNPSSFGNNAKISRGKVLIPRSGNSKIKSSVSGKIVDNLNKSSCINQIVIEFNEGYLEYCGITNPSVKNGERVRVGESLGTTSYNVTVTLYSKRQEKQGISFDDENKNETPKKKSDSFLVKTYRDLKNSGKETKKVKTPSQTNSFLVKGYRDLKKSFKVDEDIKRIKKLL